MSKKLINIGIKAKKAVKIKIDKKNKNKVLKKYLQLINKNEKIILRENNKDVEFAIRNNLPENLINRLTLNNKKITEIKTSINKILKLNDPTNKVIDKWKRPNGLVIKKVSNPIGVIGIIYESRPNVTSDVASLCFKSGNAVILRGGSEAYNSNKILTNLFRDALKINKIDQNYVQIIKDKNRKSVDYMLSRMKNFIDVIIPRGGKNLVKKVQELSSVPIIGHLEGICHTYIDKDADLNMAIKVVHNAKLRNTSICGATETILMHKKIVKKFCNPILTKLTNNNCKIFADNIIKKQFNKEKCAIIDKNGYNKYFVINGKTMKIENADLSAVNDNMKTGKIKSIFSKSMKGRIISRTLLNKFIDEVA